jgi:hypothetical protein
VRLQELLDQIAVGAMDLDAVEAGLERVGGTFPKTLDHAGDLMGLERPRRFIRRGLAFRRHRHQVRNGHRRRRHRQHAAGLERGMRHPPDMPELEENQAAFGVHGIDDVPPAPDLRFRIDAGRAGIAASCRHDRRGLGDDQAARRGALAVIFTVQRPRGKARSFRPHPGQGRHCDAMLEPVRTDLQR